MTASAAEAARAEAVRLLDLLDRRLDDATRPPLPAGLTINEAAALIVARAQVYAMLAISLELAGAVSLELELAAAEARPVP